jgi:type I restriction enzyme S subunit
MEWLGEIPDHWGRNRLKYCYNIATGGVWGEEPKGDENDIVCVRVADFDFQHGLINPTSLTVRSISLSEQKTRLLRIGDLLIEKSGGGELSPVGRVVKFNLPIKGVCSNFINRLNTKKQFDPDFLLYFNRYLYSKGITEYCINQTTGIQNLKMGEFLASTVFMPSLPEQLLIARFLDYKTAQIDRFISNRKKQIELLKEQKAAIINKAVTKGINPDAKMKPSGVEWIGEIPTEWEVMELKFVARMMRGKFSHRPRNDDRLYGGEYPFIQTGDVTKTEKYITSFSQTLNDWGHSVSKEFPKGTVVITIAANIGDVAILNLTACFPDSVVGFYSKRNLTEYLFFLIKSMKKVFLSESIEGTQLNLAVDRLSAIKVAIPEPSEQLKIIKYITNEILRIDTLVSKYQKQIDLMQEYRASLISQVVTGKIDVRDWRQN